MNKPLLIKPFVFKYFFYQNFKLINATVALTSRRIIINKYVRIN